MMSKFHKFKTCINYFFCNQKFRFFIRLFIVVIPPIIFTYLMFNPFLKINLKSNTNEPQYISKSEINKNLTSTILADFFQTSLRLGWYQVCFENQGALKMGGHTILNREDRGDIQVQIKEVLPAPFTSNYKTLSASPFKKANCMRIDSDIEGISIGTSTVSLGARINDKPEDFLMTKDNTFEMNFELSYEKINLFIKQDLASLITKYIVILILWSSLILLTQGVWKFLQIENKKMYNQNQ